MDGDSVGEPSNDDDGGAEQKAPPTLGETFLNLCPKYMAMGMTYDEFWHSNTLHHYCVRKAWEEKKHYRNWEMWMQGAYIYESLLKVSPVLKPFVKGKVEPGKYPEEPYPLSEKEAREREEMRRRERMERFVAQLNKEIEKREENEKKEASENAGD